MALRKTLLHGTKAQRKDKYEREKSFTSESLSWWSNASSSEWSRLFLSGLSGWILRTGISWGGSRSSGTRAPSRLLTEKVSESHIHGIEIHAEFVIAIYPFEMQCNWGWRFVMARAMFALVTQSAIIKALKQTLRLELWLRWVEKFLVIYFDRKVQSF